MVLVEAPAFTRLLHRYLSDEEYLRLQVHLVERPEAGVVMPGTGGFRKLRWSDSARGKGRRGGLRVIYYYFPDDAQIWLMTVYDKDEAADLTTEERRALRQAIELELAARAAKRKKRQRRRPE